MTLYQGNNNNNNKNNVTNDYCHIKRQQSDFAIFFLYQVEDLNSELFEVVLLLIFFLVYF